MRIGSNMPVGVVPSRQKLPGLVPQEHEATFRSIVNTKPVPSPFAKKESLVQKLKTKLDLNKSLLNAYKSARAHGHNDKAEQIKKNQNALFGQIKVFAKEAKQSLVDQIAVKQKEEKAAIDNKDPATAVQIHNDIQALFAESKEIEALAPRPNEF